MAYTDVLTVTKYRGSLTDPVRETFVTRAGNPEMVSAVSGTVLSGSALTISGSNLLDVQTAKLETRFATTYPNAWKFGGASAAADGYGASDGAAYSGTGALVAGGAAFPFRVTGNSSEENSGLKAYLETYPTLTEFWVTCYVRWEGDDGAFPDAYWKFLYFHPLAEQGINVQPNVNGGDWPTSFLSFYPDPTYGAEANHNWAFAPVENRYYCFEWHVKWSAGDGYHATYVDGTLKHGGAITGTMAAYNGQNLWFGCVNCKTQTAYPIDFTTRMGAFMVSTERQYPLTLVEIGDSDDYATATKVTQAVTSLSDTSVGVTCDLNGLGGGPYYLWVTNNALVRSNTYTLDTATVGPITVTASGGTDAALGIPRFKIAANPSDSTHLACACGGTDTVFQSTDSGATWAAVGAAGTIDYHTSVGMDSSGRIHLGSYNGSTGLPYYRRWTGAAWDAAVSFDDFSGNIGMGNVLVNGSNVWLFTRGSVLLDAYWHRSDDSGATWAASGTLTTAPEGLIRIGSLMWDGQPAAVLWDRNAQVFRVYRWNGSAFAEVSGTLAITDYSEYTRNFAFTATSGHVLHLVWADIVGGVWVLRHAYRSVAGSWSSPATVVTLGSNTAEPVALTHDGTTVHLFYADADRLYRMAYASSWGSAVAVTDAGGADGYVSTAPASIAGRVPVLWNDGATVYYSGLVL